MLHYLATEYDQAIADWNAALEKVPSAKHDLIPWITKAHEKLKY